MNSRTLLIATILGGCCFAALAEEIVLGTGESHAFANDAALTQDAVVRLSDRSALGKTGAGKLTLKSGMFVENQSVVVNVREGAVAIETSEPQATSYAEPTEIINRAAFWMESSQNVQMKDGSADEVETWLDVRETGDGSEANPFVYTRAVAFTNDWLTAFPVQKVYQEKTGVYCHDYGSGCFMNWLRPDGAQQNLTGIRHLFIAHGGVNSKGDILGQRKDGQPYLQRSGNNPLWINHNSENKPIHASRTYLNGHEVDPFTTTYPASSIHVVEVETLDLPLGAMCFFNDRDMQLKTTAGTNMANNAEGKAMNAILGIAAQTGGNNRAGGEYLFEVLLFTNSLTVVERMAVSDWLNQKWRGVMPPATLPATTVALATNAEFEVSGTLPATVALEGDGTLRKTGEGTFALRSFYAPRNSSRRVKVEQGSLLLGYPLPLVCAAGDTITSNRRYYGPEVQPPTAGGDPSRLVKNGSGPITLDGIPEGVTNLVVNAGELRLADPERSQNLVPPATETVAVEIPDADFEAYPATSPTAAYSYIGNGQVVRGWHAVVPGLIGESTADSAVFFYDQRLGSPTGWNMNLQTPPTGVFVIKNNASAWCEVDIPSDGDYVLSFRAAPRAGYTGDQLDVMIGPDENSLVSFGAFKTTVISWQTFTFSKIRLSAGRQQLWFKSKVLNTDRCTQFDDIRLVRESDAHEWALPNGGFELHTSAFSRSFTAANATCVPGFTVKACDTPGSASEGNQGISTFTARGTDSNAHFNLPWNRTGSETQFYLSGSGSQLSTTFTPPAGTWRFRADSCFWAESWGYESYWVSAQIALNGEQIFLGTLTNISHALIPRDWPNAFTVDGETPVTLTLTGALPTATQRAGHAIFDNLALVRVVGAGENLLKQGGFEAATPWRIVVTPKPTAVGGSQRQDYGSFYQTHFGMEKFEGSYCVKLVNDDVIAQTVTFPTGGLYRFSASMESRSAPGSGSFGNGQNPVAFFMARNGVTNWLGCTDKVTMTNFHEYACIVRVPEAGGTYDVGFQGQSVWGGSDSSKVDRTTILDGAQLYRIETEKPIDLPEQLEIAVAAEAQLTLDFDGTNEVRSLSIAGKKYVGVVSLADNPELLGTLNGRGALFIRPRGTVILFR